MRVDFSHFGANQVLLRNVRRFFIHIWDHPNHMGDKRVQQSNILNIQFNLHTFLSLFLYLRRDRGQTTSQLMNPDIEQ